MRGPLRMRALTEEEERVISKLVCSRTASVRLVHRAKIIHLASQGETIPQIMKQLEEAVEEATNYWNAHKHPFVWGRRRRHQPPRVSQKSSFQVKTLRI